MQLTHVHRTTLTYVILKFGVRAPAFKCCLCNYVGQGAYNIIFACSTLSSVHLTARVLALLFNIICNFEDFSSLNHYKINKRIINLLPLFQISSGQVQYLRCVPIKKCSENNHQTHKRTRFQLSKPHFDMGILL